MCRKCKKIKISVTNLPLKLLLIMKGGVSYEESVKLDSCINDIG